MDTSIFPDKSQTPSLNDLKKALGSSYKNWIAIRDYVFEKYPAAFEEWNYPGAKYGWSFRIKDKKRAIVYLLPRDGYFKLAMIFGAKASDAIFNSNISDAIIQELKAARVYAEGRGIRLDITEESNLSDIKQMIDFKLAY